MEMKGFTGFLYRISEWVMRFFVINLLWALCSFPSSPLMILLFLYLPWENTADMYYMFTLWGVLTPITFFPATTAMFTVVRKWQMGDTDVPLFKTFFRGFISNYKQSLLGGLIYVLLIGLLAVNVYFYTYIVNDSMLSALAFLFIGLIVVAFISLFHFFSILAHLHMGTIRIVLNALMMTIGRPFTSFFLVTSNFFVLYMSYFVFSFLVPFFMGTIMAFLSFFYFHQAFTRMQEKVFKKDGVTPPSKQSGNDDEEETDGRTGPIDEPTYFHLKNKDE